MNPIQAHPPPLMLSIRKTHSIPWLAQFVSQIITATGWEQEFKCEGVENLADFKAVIDDFNSVDPGSYVCHWPVDPEALSSVRAFVRKADTLLELLASTADALAAEWDLRDEATEEDDRSGGGFEPTIP